MEDPLNPQSGRSTLMAWPVRELPESGLPLAPWLRTRTKDGALASVRIPVTAANRPLLRELRAAELAAWSTFEPRVSA